MAFNELNSVEHFIIHQLSGVDFNKGGLPAVAETAEQAMPKWRYQWLTNKRGVNEVLVESELKATLIGSTRRLPRSRSGPRGDL